MKVKLLIFCLLFGVVLMVTSDLSNWEVASLCLFVYCFTSFMFDLGGKIVVMDLAILMAVLCCLVMPVVFYHEYTRDNKLAFLWRKYMPIPSDSYFGFAFPAILMMIIGLKAPLGRLNINRNPKKYLDNVKDYLKTKPTLGLYLIGVGVVSGLLDFLTP